MIGTKYCQRCGHTVGCVGHNPEHIKRGENSTIRKCRNCGECQDSELAIARLYTKLMELRRQNSKPKGIGERI